MNKKKRVVQLLLIVILCMVFFAGTVLKKLVKINSVFLGANPVTGVDISHYQGTVDMEKLYRQDVTFAYIKATEGSESVDEKFAENWRNGRNSKLHIGAYHFFSFDSSGDKQARHFIATVGDLHGTLVPVVDVEYYGDKEKNPPDSEDVTRELSEFLDILEKEYGVKPMIYTTQKVYMKYIKDTFGEYPLWLRSVYYPVQMVVGKEWTLWQYSDTEVLDGYDGEEKYIDRNVLHGSEETLRKMLCP
ncbi:MAG: GH25 family lysozyme [Eubacteriales bacterium]|nr:GH25 family lysozyme [Eubacteriales bacterium]